MRGARLGLLALICGAALAVAVVGATAATLGGTKSGDRLVGTGGPDRLNGKAGNDFMKGKAGNDLLRGGTWLATGTYKCGSSGDGYLVVHIGTKSTPQIPVDCG